MEKIIWLLKNMHRVPRHESNECNCILKIYFKKLGLPKNPTFVDQILNELQHFHPKSCSTFGLKENMPFIFFFSILCGQAKHNLPSTQMIDIMNTKQNF